MGSKYEKAFRKRDYIALEDLEHGFNSEVDIPEFDRLYKDGYPLWKIAQLLRFEDEDQALILMIDRSRKGKIKAREGGICGNGSWKEYEEWMKSHAEKNDKKFEGRGRPKKKKTAMN